MVLGTAWGVREGTLASRVVKCLVGVRCCSGMPKKLVSLSSDAKRSLEIVPDTLRKYPNVSLQFSEAA